MNAQIEILAALSTNIECGVDNGFDRVTIDTEKFAELIVAECVNMIEAAAENADEDDVHGMRNAAGLISRAFITFYDVDLKNERTN
jgi:hypothetical protein